MNIFRLINFIINLVHFIYWSSRFQSFGWGSRVSFRSKISGHKFIQIGKHARISYYVMMDTTRKNQIIIGNHTKIRPFCLIEPEEGFIHIHDNININHFCRLLGGGGITIKENSRLANGTTVIAESHEYKYKNTPIIKQGITRKGITVEEDCWIGANSIILDSITIQKGTVIGAGTVVTKSTPSYSIQVGNPNRKIKERL